MEFEPECVPCIFAFQFVNKSALQRANAGVHTGRPALLSIWESPRVTENMDDLSLCSIMCDNETTAISYRRSAWADKANLDIKAASSAAPARPR